jgi:general stress protein YciG
MRHRILTDVVTPDGRIIHRVSDLTRKRAEAGRLGGLATRERYGVEFFRAIGRRGGITSR